MKFIYTLTLVLFVPFNSFSQELPVNLMPVKGTPGISGIFCVHNGEMYFANPFAQTSYTLDGSWQQVPVSDSGLRSNVVYHIDAHNNSFYFATNAGLCIKDGPAWRVESSSNSNLSTDLVQYVQVSDDLILLATGDGLSYKYNGNQWVNISRTRTKTSLLAGRLTTSLFELDSVIYWSGSGSTGYFVVYDIRNDTVLFPQGIVARFGLGKTPTEIYAHSGDFGGYSDLVTVTDSIESLLDQGICVNDGFASFNLSPLHLKMFTDKRGVLWRYEQTIYDQIVLSSLENNAYHPGYFYLPLVDIHDQVIGYDEITDSVYAVTDGFVFSLNDVRKLNNQMPKTMAVLDINRTSTPIINNGVQNRDFEFNSDVYRSDKDECTSPLYSTSLWIGGYDAQQNPHLAAMLYGQSGRDFWPGPLDTTDGSYIPAGSVYDRVWKVNLNDIRQHIQVYDDLGSVAENQTTEAIWNWPGNGSGRVSGQLAPFVDLNGNGLYEPAKGDYPDIKGDQCIYWIMNDNASAHTESGGDPFGFEIHAMAYSYTCSELTSSDSFYGINYTTFYRYKIINRSNTDYNNVTIGSYVDVDLGNYADDLVGCHVTLNLAYGYNADSIDEGLRGYGLNPPMISALMLHAPHFEHDGVDGDQDGQVDEADEKRYMGGFMTYDNDFTIYGNPGKPEDYLNYLNGRWKDSSCFTHDGAGGKTGSNCTRYLYPGSSNPDQPVEWTQQTNGIPADQRMLMNTYAFDIKSNETVEYEYALIHARDPGQFDQLPHTLTYVRAIRDWYYNGGQPGCFHPLTVQNPDDQPGKIHVYPVPSIEQITIQCYDGIEMVRMVDLTGREVMRHVPGEKSQEVVLALSGLVPNIYIVEVTTAKGKLTSKLVHGAQ